MLRNFLNTLRRYPMASTLNIIGLSVAFAAFIVIMTQVKYELSYDKFHSKGDRIYKVDLMQTDMTGITVLPRALIETLGQSSPKIESYSLFQDAWQSDYLTFDKNGTKIGFVEDIAFVYPSFSDIFDFQMIEGTAKALEEPDKILLPESIARKFFVNESALGKILTIDKDQTLEVGGVYKDFPSNSQIKNDIYRRLPDSEGRTSDGEYHWDRWNFFMYLTLVEGTDPSEIEKNYANMINLSEKLEEEEGIHAKLTLLSDIYFDAREMQVDYMVSHGNRNSTNLMIAIAFLILAIAGINFVNFSTSMAPMRMKSINIQKVLGSLNGKLRVMLTTEAVGLCILSFGLGLLIVYVMSKSSFQDITLSGISFDTSIIIATGCVALILGVVAGVYPAFYITRFPPMMVLKGNFGVSKQGKILRSLLIGFQYVVSISLIVAAMCMQLQNSYMRNADTGLKKDNIAVIKLGGELLGNPALKDKLCQNPLIEDVAYSQFDIFGSNRSQGWGFERKGKRVEFRTILVSWNFMEMMNLKLVEGKYPTEKLENNKDTPIYLNELAIKQGGIEIGEEYPWGGGKLVASGVLKDFNFESLHSKIIPMMIAVTKSDWFEIGYVKINGNPYEAVDYIKKTVAEIDPAYPFDLWFFDQSFNKLYEKEQKSSAMISLFSVLAVIISLVGVFGLVVFETQYRRKEIGLRKINGATVGSILMMFNGKFIILVGVCFAIAVPIAWYGTDRWLSNFAFRTPLHWWVFATALLIVLLITILTVTVQTWRAAMENPVNSLKSE